MYFSTHTNSLTSVIQSKVSACRFFALSCRLIIAHLAVQEITKWIPLWTRVFWHFSKKDPTNQRAQWGVRWRRIAVGWEKGPGYTPLSFQTCENTHIPTRATAARPLSARGEALRWRCDSSYCVPVLRWVLYNGLAKQVAACGTTGLSACSVGMHWQCRCDI